MTPRSARRLEGVERSPRAMRERKGERFRSSREAKSGIGFSQDLEGYAGQVKGHQARGNSQCVESSTASMQRLIVAYGDGPISSTISNPSTGTNSKGDMVLLTDAVLQICCLSAILINPHGLSWAALESEALKLNGAWRRCVRGGLGSGEYPARVIRELAHRCPSILTMPIIQNSIAWSTDSLHR